MSKAISVVLIILFFVLGFAGGYLLADSQNKAKIAQLQKSYAEFKSNVDKYFPEPPKKINSMSGMVKNVDQSSILVSIPVLSKSRYPWEQSKETPRSRDLVLRIGKDTKIIKREFVSPTKENNFSPFKDTEISVSSIKKGTIVSFTSDQNILDKKEVFAKEIIINAQPVIPQPPVPASEKKEQSK